MSVMKFRESNQVRWFGVRPAHNWTQKIKYNAAQGSTVDLLQVSSGKTGYLTTLIITVSASASGHTFQLNYTDDTGTVITRLLNDVMRAANTIGFSVTFNPPFEMDSGYKLQLYSSNSALRITAFAILGEE